MTQAKALEALNALTSRQGTLYQAELVAWVVEYVHVVRQALQIDWEPIETRIKELRAWMAEHAPYLPTDQRHLDGGTVEQAYWHYGYLTGLKDAQNLLSVAPKENTND